MKNIFAVAVLFLCAVSLGACGNTLDGMGRDISKAGDKIEETF